MRTPLFSAQSGRRDRRGSISAQTAILLPVFIGSAALAIDGGFLFLAQAQARVASDSAVLAATSVFEANESETVAETRAIAAVNAHRVGTSAHATITADDLHWANWDGANLTTGVAFEDANAAMVDVSEPFGSFFSGFWGDFDLSGNSDSRAIVTSGPAGKVICFLPIALPHCRYPSANADDVTVNEDPYTINSGSINTVAWAMPDSSPNTNDLRAQFLDICGNTPTGVSTGDPIQIGNGWNAAILPLIGDIINNTPPHQNDPPPDAAEAWPADLFPTRPARDGGDRSGYLPNHSLIAANRYGEWMIGGPIPLVDVGGEPGDCSGQGQLNGDPIVVGFTYGFIFDVRTSGGSANRGMKLQLDYVNDYDFGVEIDPDAIGNVTADSPPQLIP